MLLRAFSQLNFRNLNTPQLSFEPGITAVVGQNAAGKSNLLEAVYLGCTGELPGGKIAETVRIGETEGFVALSLERDDGLSRIHVGLAPGRKLVRIDGQTVRALELAKVAAAVLITPEDAELVHGSPSNRRAYLDGLLSKLSLRYALLLREYNRVVEQRNAALKLSPSMSGLEVWSQKFVDLGQEIMDLRQRALVRIAEIAEATYGEIASDKKELGVRLQSQHDADLEGLLLESRDEERARGVTVVGPHREDVALELSGHSVQAYGSRGEARTTSLALRVAEYQLLKEKHGEAPLLLLDDFTAELDVNRRGYLLELAANTPQALVSGTEAPPRYDRLLYVAAGSVRDG